MEITYFANLAMAASRTLDMAANHACSAPLNVSNVVDRESRFLTKTPRREERERNREHEEDWRRRRMSWTHWSAESRLGGAWSNKERRESGGEAKVGADGRRRRDAGQSMGASAITRERTEEGEGDCGEPARRGGSVWPARADPLRSSWSPPGCRRGPPPGCRRSCCLPLRLR